MPGTFDLLSIRDEDSKDRTTRSGLFVNRFVKTFRHLLKLGFSQKISVHIFFMTLFTGIVITGATAYQFRRDIIRLEFGSAHLVYTATANFLSGHYISRNEYVPRSINYVLRQRFLRPEHDENEEYTITHRPSHLIVYDELGRILYEYRDEQVLQEARSVPPDELPPKPTIDLLAASNMIRVAGPISQDGRAPGSLIMYIPTTISQQMAQLLYRSVLLMLFVLAITMLMSTLFVRQVLSPVRALTSATRAAHRGDPYQSVPVVTDDEIGELTETFNEMTLSVNRRMDFMHRMQEWTVRIGRQLDTQRLFEALGEMFERLSMANSYRLYLCAPETKKLEVRLEYGAEDLPKTEEDKLARMALDERWTMYLKAGGIPDNEPVDVEELAIPLLSGKHRVGVIRIGRKSDRSLYDDDTLTILQTLAQHASVAIDNANLYERLAAQERMAQEMTLARQIQQSMLPGKAPDISGYDIVGGSTPALEVGGDYYDYVCRDGQCYMMIGDVSGKGVPAALIMSIVRALIHTYLEFETSPCRVLRNVNRNISADLDPEMFVTMYQLQLDPEQHRLLMARAGHEPVMVVHADGKVENIAPPGTALGMLDEQSFEDMLKEEACELQKDDTVLLYTDGITEAQNKEHKEFGYERLEQLVVENKHLPVRELYDTILTALRDFSNGAPQSDDITLVILRRTGNGAS